MKYFLTVLFAFSFAHAGEKHKVIPVTALQPQVEACYVKFFKETYAKNFGTPFKWSDRNIRVPMLVFDWGNGRFGHYSSCFPRDWPEPERCRGTAIDEDYSYGFHPLNGNTLFGLTVALFTDDAFKYNRHRVIFKFDGPNGEKFSYSTFKKHKQRTPYFYFTVDYEERDGKWDHYVKDLKLLPVERLMDAPPMYNEADGAKTVVPEITVPLGSLWDCMKAIDTSLLETPEPLEKAQ